MKRLNNYINEKLNIGKLTKPQYTCQPKDKDELREILKERLDKDKNANLNDIDVSIITDMGVNNNFKGLFQNLDPHNIDVSQWDVSNVKDMYAMFLGCENLECDLSGWDVSNVEDMRDMFCYCKKFNCDLSNWDTSKVKDMYAMFFRCSKFTGEGLENWDVSNVEKMSFMLEWCENFKNKPSWYKNENNK